MDNKYGTEFRSSQNPFLVILLLGSIVFLGYRLGTLSLHFLFKLFSGRSIVEVATSGNSIELLLIQGITSSFALLIGPALFLKYWMHTSISDLVNRKINSRLILFSIVLMFVVIPFNSFLVEWNTSLSLPSFFNDFSTKMLQREAEQEELVLHMLNFKSPITLLFAITVIGLLPALGEELLFRGLIQKIFLKNINQPYIAVLLVAIVFSAFHQQFHAFFPRLMLGLLLGLLYYWSGNLIYSIIFHFLNNSFIVVFYYLFNNGVLKTNIMDNPTLPYLTVIFSFLVTLVSLLYFRRISLEENKY